ncbi:hypothetical protein D3C72_1680740 [compost metagenome]
MPQGRAEHQPQQQAASQHLQGTQYEDLAAHGPQALGRQFQADDEQHHHHAPLRDANHRVHIRHELQARRPDQHACDQVARNGSQAQPLGDGHTQHGRKQKNEDEVHGTRDRLNGGNSGQRMAWLEAG